jgi:uncharacterized protein YlxW (UPF0749 family)
MMTDVQFWSILVTFIGTIGGQKIVEHFLGRGKFRSDDAALIRKELREERQEREAVIRELKAEIRQLEGQISQFRIHRIDMYRVLQENNVPQEVLAKLRILEAS